MNPYNNVSDTYEFDWGSTAQDCSQAPITGTPLVHTGTQYDGTAAEVTGNIVGLPNDAKTYNGSGNLIAETQYQYDVGGIQTYASISGLSSPAAARANRTAVLNCGSISGGSCAWWFTTTYGFDTAGNVVSIKDPNGNNYSLSYTDSYSSAGGNPPQPTYARVTQLTDPLGEFEQWQWDWGLGKPVRIVDENEAVTANSFNDPLDRLTQVIKAQGTSAETHTNAVYTGANQVDVYQDQNTAGESDAGGGLHTESLYDGFGRIASSYVKQGSTLISETDTVYDGLGRVSQKSNPYSGTAPVYTTSLYDGLDRVKSVTTPDGVAATTVSIT